jgi:hypothetical protein
MAHRAVSIVSGFRERVDMPAVVAAVGAQLWQGSDAWDDSRERQWPVAALLACECWWLFIF